jgi:ABC-type sulfate/molybdate transport systems ATPase subunit
MTDALRLDRIRKSHGARRLLTDAVLVVPAGATVALVGPSGIGKTTLLRIAAGLDVPDSGDVWIGSELATRGARILLPPHQRGIGFVFQDLGLWPHMTVAQSLAFVLGSAPSTVSRGDQRRIITEMLQLVHIDALGDRYPHQLSGGEQQRAAVARALVHRPPLLLLDEPFSSLDLELRDAMRTMLRELRAVLGFATVLVTHDRLDAAALADRTIAITQGGAIQETPA